tara:strand:+ start:16 stop:315 length:300 start_codon:yes stop_codon:yes gene_type:complete
MSRYTNTPITSSLAGKQMYTTVRYPEMIRLENDIYIFTTIGDRFDTLAQQYYGDSSLWWVISNANGNLSKDSLTPPEGSQIRIPANPTITIADYNEINE